MNSYARDELDVNDLSVPLVDLGFKLNLCQSQLSRSFEYTLSMK